MATLAESDAIGRDRANEVLRPYVPRLVIDWLRQDPDGLSREIEGSMAFVDISGFTALSERLARRGKIGAELMRDTLNDVFIALLDTAYEDGAGLLKWGGDALLLLFDGPGHAERACHACWEMQRTLDRVGRLKAGGATIVLRMSIGITTGTFQFFLTGSVHRELLVAGPAATETVTMEAIADAGEIAVSPRLAALLDPACIGEPKETALLLKRSPEVVGKRAPDVGDVSGLDLPLCLPLAVRAHVMLERSEPEHRTITAAFIDMMDTDRQLERLGLQGLGEALDDRIRTIQEAALKYEVPFYESDVGKSSVKALLTAGAPSTTGHDEERMLRALREIMETPSEIAMRIGVNTGRVFTGDFGPWYRRSYRVFGDAINTAARVMSKAEAGQVLATEIVLERSRTAFETTPIEPFAAKGKAEPIRASIVGPVIGQRVADVRETPFVGRERELETLLRVVEDARQSRGWIVDLSGATGLGKTRLLQDLIGKAGDIFVFHTRCEEYESSTPYFPFRAPFRAVLGLSAGDGADAVEQRLRTAAQQVDPTIVPWVPLFGVLLGVDIPHTPETKALEERFIPERLADVMMRFLYTSLAGTTTMLVVEDAQHMDESSRDLLRRLARAGIDRKQVLFVTHDGTGSLFDPAEVDDLHALSFTLAPLSVPAAVAMVNGVTEDDPLPPHVVEEIARRSAGSPLFLFELLDVVRETGSVEALPDSVEAVVAADIDRLAPGDRTVLRYAAVFGTSFDPSLLAVALQDEVEVDDGVWGRLGDLVERKDGEGELRFRNTLIREAAYEGLPFRRRRVLHGRIAEALEHSAGEEEIGALALHYYEAQRWDKAWNCGRQAGDRARSIYANVEAVRFYRRALASAQRARGARWSDVVNVAVALGDTHLLLGDYGSASSAYRVARRKFKGDAPREAELYLKEASVGLRTRNFPRMMRWLNRGLRVLDGIRGQEATIARAELYLYIARARRFQGRIGDAIAWCDRAIIEAGRAGVGGRETLAGAYFTRDQAYVNLGQVEQAVHMEMALEIYESSGNLSEAGRVLNTMSVRALQLGHWDEQLRLLDRAHDAFDRSGDTWALGIVAYNMAERLIEQGRAVDAEPLARACLRLWKGTQYASDAAEAASLLGLVLGHLGRFDEALEMLDEARHVLGGSGEATEEMRAELRLAECLLLQGGGAKALDLASAALGRVATTEGAAVLLPSIHRLRGLALVALGRMDEAKHALDESLAASHGDDPAGVLGDHIVSGGNYEAGLTLHALGRLSQLLGRDGSEYSEAAADILSPLGVVAVQGLPLDGAP